MQEIVIEIMNRFWLSGDWASDCGGDHFSAHSVGGYPDLRRIPDDLFEDDHRGVILYPRQLPLPAPFTLWSGALLSPQRLGRLLDSKFCKRLGFKKEEISDTLKWFDGRGRKAVSLADVCRLSAASYLFRPGWQG